MLAPTALGLGFFSVNRLNNHLARGRQSQRRFGGVGESHRLYRSPKFLTLSNGQLIRTGGNCTERKISCGGGDGFVLPLVRAAQLYGRSRNWFSRVIHQ